jgi:hypothetical protein
LYWLTVSPIFCILSVMLICFSDNSLHLLTVRCLWIE